MKKSNVALLLFLLGAACRPAAAPSPSHDAGVAAAPPTEDASTSDVAPPADTTPPTEPASSSTTTTTAFKQRDINHVLSTGQSLAVGVAGAPPLSTTQPFANLMFTTGVMAGNEDLVAFEPLVEGDNIPGSKAVVETMSAGFANLVAEMSRSKEMADATPHDILVSVHASGAKPYANLKKGTKPYNNGMIQVTAARDIAKKLGKSYVVRAVTNVHGESDHAEKNTHYEADMLEWQRDYETDVRALTGQTEPVPMFETQMSSWTRMMKGTATSDIPQAQLAAHLHSNGKIILVGPKYHLHYSKDGVHLTANGYRHMGEDYAKAYRRVVLEGKKWEPLRPINVTREGAVITIKFAVPSPPLTIDTTLVQDPGRFGFEYSDTSATSPPITRVEVQVPDTVIVTLQSVPTGDDRRIRYAFTGNKGLRSGPETGARGNLRDSDSTRSRNGYRLYNWCIHFDEPVP